MKYRIILNESWMGDTLFACNVVKNISNLGIEISLIHKWEFMNELIDLFEIKHNFFIYDPNEKCNDIFYSGRLDLYENPLIDYAKVFNLPNIDINSISKFYSLHNSFRNKYRLHNDEFYITYENDWNLRTKLNTSYIIEQLKLNNIKCIPIGGNRSISDKISLIESSKILIDSKMHLGITAGTTNLAAFLNTKTIGLSDHLFNFYINQQGHGTNRKMSEEEFLNEFKPFPYHWANKKHITCHPNITEDEYINLILNEIKRIN